MSMNTELARLQRERDALVEAVARMRAERDAAQAQSLQNSQDHNATLAQVVEQRDAARAEVARLTAALIQTDPWKWKSSTVIVCKYCGAPYGDHKDERKHVAGCVWGDAALRQPAPAQE